MLDNNNNNNDNDDDVFFEDGKFFHGTETGIKLTSNQCECDDNE